MLAIRRSRRASGGNSARLGDGVGEELFAERSEVGGLGEADAEEFADFPFGRLEARVGLEQQVAAALLAVEDGAGVVVEAGGDDAVGDFAAQVFGEGGVDVAADGGEIAVAGDEVAAAGAGVGGCDGRERGGVDLIGGGESIGDGAVGVGDGCAGGGDVLEAGGGGQAGGGVELADELPGGEGVEQVDVAGPAVEHVEGERVGDGGRGGGRLVRVEPVAERDGFRGHGGGLSRRGPGRPRRFRGARSGSRSRACGWAGRAGRRAGRTRPRRRAA